MATGSMPQKSVASDGKSSVNDPFARKGRPKPRLYRGVERCTTTPALVVSVNTADVEIDRHSHESALRLYCRAMLRLYFKECGDSNNGERVGVL